MAKGVLIKPTIMRWAIHSSGKSITSLEEKFQKITEWVEKESEVTVNELNKLSKELKIPFGYFFMNEPPVEEIELLKYRTVDNIERERISRELIDTITAMEIRQAFMREIMVEDGFQPLTFVGSATLKDNPKELASIIKKQLNLKNNWNRRKADSFKILREAASRIGILVMQNGVVGNNNTRSLDVEEFRAFVLMDDYAPLIFINAKDSKTAKLFSLCHEIVHIWVGVQELYNENDNMNQNYNNKKLEQFCNEVTAEILIPTESLASEYNETRDVLENIQALSKEYGVSELVVCIRLKNTKIINQSTFNEVYPKILEEMRENLEKKEKNKKNNRGDFYNTARSRLDPNFVYSVNRKAKEGRILYTEAYRLVGAKGKTFDNLVRHMEGGR